MSKVVTVEIAQRRERTVEVRVPDDWDTETVCEKLSAYLNDGVEAFGDNQHWESEGVESECDSVQDNGERPDYDLTPSVPALKLATVEG